MTDENTESLESLAAQFEVQQSPPVQRTESSEPPKFESPEDGVNWLASQYSQTRAELEKVSQNLSQREQEAFVNDQLKALDLAVKTVGEGVELDPSLVEGFLHTTYNRDKNFAKIFDNRGQNPQAYEKALAVLSGQLKAKTSVKHDPQITENNRALEQLQRSARTGARESIEDTVANMSASEFDRYWERLKSG